MSVANRPTPKWPEDAEAAVVRLWSAGLPASQIARQINEECGTHYTRNAVIGKAHRMDLQARPSPIKITTGTRSAQRRRTRQARENVLQLPNGLGDDEVGEVAPEHTIPMTKPRRGGCQWIDREPMRDDSCKCGKVVKEGITPPYCAEHFARAYRKKPTAEEKALRPKTRKSVFALRGV